MAENRHRQDRDRDGLPGEVGKKEKRKLKARSERKSVWFGLGMFGMVGWAVAIPTLVGIALGVWLDARYASERSWTLALLLAGLCVGCLNAWYWMKREGPDRE